MPYKKAGSSTLPEATKKMEHYCAYQERCHKEVSQKLHEMGMIPLAIDHIIAHLIKENYLNEERYARAYARGKFHIKKWGRQRIINELKLRDINRYIIQMALTEIDDAEYIKTLDILARKKWGQLTETNSYKKRKKLSDYLLYRGWESQLIYEKLQELI